MLGFACTQCPRSQPSALPSPSGRSGDFGQGFFWPSSGKSEPFNEEGNCW